MIRRVASPLVVLAILVGCSGAEPSSTLTPASAGTQTVAPEPTSNAETPQPTANAETPAPATDPTPNAETPSPTAVPEGKGAVVREGMIRYQHKYSDYPEATIYIEVKNIGTGWIEVLARESDWTVYNEAGEVVDTGKFAYAYPRYLAPGETGYLAEDYPFVGEKLADLVRVETNSYSASVDESDVIVLKTAKTKNTRDTNGEGYETSGVVTNTSAEEVPSAHVGAFYFNANGKLIGFSYTNLVENLGAGQTKGFKTLAYTKITTKIATTKVYASPSY